MLRKLCFLLAALLLGSGVVYAVGPIAVMTGTITASGGGVACVLGPNSPPPTGTAATDTTTAGFTTCALNSDFTTALFANFNNWLGGVNSCGSPSTPIWYNSNSTASGAPCSDYTIITDGGGQVLDMKYTDADAAAGRNSTQLISITGQGGQGQVYPTGMYVEQRFRLSAHSPHAWDSTGQNSNLTFQPFKYVPNGFGGAPFIEWDFSEFYWPPPGITGSVGCRNGSSASGCNSVPPDSMQYCPTGCTNFDATIYHTYGNLITTDGNQHMSVCWYLDGTKLGCQNFTDVTPATTTFQALEQLIIELGGNNVVPGFVGPLDVYYQYFRVFSCSTWNAGGAVCTGTLVTG